jgi:glutaredoxin
MYKNLLITLSIIFGVILILLLMFLVISKYFSTTEVEDTVLVETKPKSFMLLIALEDTDGLVNFVNDMKERNIPGLLLVSANFVEKNCEVVNTLLDYHDLEIAGVDGSQPYWDVDYEKQSNSIKEVKEQIYECTGEHIRVFGSKYFAYDENTIQAAQENEIEYVLARGTTGAKSTIYKPDEYNVKIFSVSNVESYSWGTGSLCDYSYWAREGTPVDFERELFGALQHDKISPVTHTYIGGIKKSWNDVYIKFFNQADVVWLDLDSFGEVDIYLPFSQIPTNRDVQYDTPHPAIPLDEEEDINNPCSVDDIRERIGTNNSSQSIEENTVVMFHNNTGPMCLDALAFFKENNIKYTEHINTDSDYAEILRVYREKTPISEGYSTNFGYFPMIFIKDKAYSGFDINIGNEIKNLLGI